MELKDFINKHTIVAAIIGGVACVLYLITGGMPLIYILMGPPIFIISFFKGTLGSALDFIPWNNDFLFTIPVAMLYFLGIGFHFSRMVQEKGALKLISMAALFGFLGLIHFLAWKNIAIYYAPISL